MKFMVGGIVILGALGWLGYIGFQQSKAEYVPIDKYSSMKNKLQGKNIKLAGDVVAGSIDRSKSHMEFVIGSSGVTMRVRYVGKEIIPDSFKEGTKALVEGAVDAEGIFQARHIEAKCASKYEAEYKKRNSS
jgi:cytochrome c-type biogenesis protein CcmE